MPKICEMDGVREHTEGWPVELWRDERTGRLVIVAYNEAANNQTVIDLPELLSWLRVGPGVETVSAEEPELASALRTNH